MTNIIEVKNPTYSREDKLAIDCTIILDDGREFPFTATPHDNMEHGKELWIALNVKKYGEIASYVENR